MERDGGVGGTRQPKHIVFVATIDREEQ
jgi:hypothetical protein